MKETVIIRRKSQIRISFEILKKDIVLTISFILAAASCLIQAPKLEYINFSVLISLFNLMVVIKAFEELRLLDKLAIQLLNHCHNSRSVSAILILLCFFSSMFLTNDVALLTFVPLTLIISKKTNLPMMETIILQTVAANIGSSLTPMGNPQNLFIYSYFGVRPIHFFTTVLFMAILGIGLLYFCIHRLKKKELQVDLIPITIHDWKKSIVWGIVLVIIIASIFGMIPYQVACIITVISSLMLNAKLLMKIDYLLLLTFICFFVFIGNLSHADVVSKLAKTILNDTTSVYFSSIVFSQFISNVPTSILLANFTTEWKPLLLGVNIGGLGTLIASLASVISYKLFIHAYPEENKRYLVKFSIINFIFLAFFTIIQFLFFTMIR